jgi:hypothetical protein
MKDWNGWFDGPMSRDEELFTVARLPRVSLPPTSQPATTPLKSLDHLAGGPFYPDPRVEQDRERVSGGCEACGCSRARARARTRTRTRTRVYARLEGRRAPIDKGAAGENSPASERPPPAGRRRLHHPEGCLPRCRPHRRECAPLRQQRVAPVVLTRAAHLEAGGGGGGAGGAGGAAPPTPVLHRPPPPGDARDARAPPPETGDDWWWSARGWGPKIRSTPRASSSLLASVRVRCLVLVPRPRSAFQHRSCRSTDNRTLFTLYSLISRFSFFIVPPYALITLIVIFSSQSRASRYLRIFRHQLLSTRHTRFGRYARGTYWGSYRLLGSKTK